MHIFFVLVDAQPSFHNPSLNNQDINKSANGMTMEEVMRIPKHDDLIQVYSLGMGVLTSQ